MNMKVYITCEGRKGSVKNPAAITIELHLSCNSGGYSRFYADALYSNELGEWYFSRMNHVIDEQVIIKHLFDNEHIFSPKVCKRIEKIWKNKKWWKKIKKYLDFFLKICYNNLVNNQYT